VAFPLFDVVPACERQVSRAPLGSFPTPVESLRPVARELGVLGSDAWVKRDDISSPAYGGNKVRTLELLFGQAKALGHEQVISTGAFGSNHALATAIHAPRVGLEPGALLFPQPISWAAFSNLRALAETGARLHSLPHWSVLPFGMAWLRLAPRPRPYVMVPGGATPLGALGYVSAALELGRQIAAGQLPAPRRVIVGVGSTCTSAGLLVGLALAAHVRLGFEPKAVPWLTSVRVSPWPVTSRSRILRLAARTARLLHVLSAGSVPLFDGRTLGARFEVDGRFLGPGYGEPSRSGTEAEALWQRLGLPLLDSTYSAKAAARVVAGLRAGEPGPVLFWSTKSSVPMPAQGVTPTQENHEASIPPRIRAWLFRAERTLAAEREPKSSS
jgi:1-aminocyclopropane-1-carboxylate deaminase/D-cysteine desulfhydrase-like pyridoxal-dependent ACC family enzyme